MKTRGDCYACLRRLALQAAEFAALNPGTRQKVTAKGLEILEANFSLDEVSIVIAAKIYEAIREITGNTDPLQRIERRGNKSSKGIVSGGSP